MRGLAFRHWRPCTADVRVIVFDRAALPEICGTAAIYCDPTDPKDIARKLRRLLTSSQLQSEMKEAGLIRAALFSWARAASQQLEEILLRNQRALA